MLAAQANPVSHSDRGHRQRSRPDAGGSPVSVTAALPQEINGIRYRVQMAAGLMWASDCLSPETYFDNANAASARARESGLEVVQYSSEANDSGVLALAQWAHELTVILSNNQLSLNCQPVTAAADVAAPLYYEVLHRPPTPNAPSPRAT
jgi:hypothetical protein